MVAREWENNCSKIIARDLRIISVLTHFYSNFYLCICFFETHLLLRAKVKFSGYSHTLLARLPLAQTAENSSAPGITKLRTLRLSGHLIQLIYRTRVHSS